MKEVNLKAPLKSLRQQRDGLERILIENYLKDLDGNVALTARCLRISLSTLWRRIERYGIDVSLYRPGSRPWGRDLVERANKK